ncbi:MAG: hypothetical protein JNM39_18045 [Bdellovibrionaceae bacterium]|nr:hypothetical protein [Pseudobdellovibrionaceae bacterium]
MDQLASKLTMGIYTCFLTFGCYKSSQAPNNKTEAKPTIQADGSSTGGGSFGDESSLTILKWASEDLARQIANSSPEIYRDLPNGWTQQKLVDIIRDVKPSVDSPEDYVIPEVSRYGKRLMFNYVSNADGSSFITATRLFLDSYSHYEVNSRPKHEFFKTLEEVKLKLVHEAAHLMALGLSKETDMPEARDFAKGLLASLDSDNIECVPTTAPPKQIYTPIDISYLQKNSKEDFEKRTIAFVFNRPTGKAAVPRNGLFAYDDPPAAYPPGYLPNNSSGHISVFAPRTYDAKFSFPTIVKSIKTGVRDYGYPGGYFSWNLVDLRQAVLTKDGYRSNFDYAIMKTDPTLAIEDKTPQMNSKFNDYLDFRIIKNSISNYEIETYPPLQQDPWAYYRSQGKARISINFTDGKIADSKLVILKDFNLWLEKPPSKDLHLEVPLTCIRSFKPLTLPE